MNPFSLPSVVKCPSCGRTNGVPTRGGTFDCMFCGVAIDLNRLPSVEPVVTSQETSNPTFFQPRESAMPLPGVSYTGATEGSYDPGSNILLTYPWRRPTAWWGLLGSAAYLAFVAFLFSGDLFGGGGMGNFLVTVIGLSLLYSGLSGVYRSLAQLLNTTTLRKQDGMLIAVHRPIPWGGAQVKTADIERIVVEGSRSTSRNRPSHQDIKAVLQGKRRVTLVPDVKDAADAQAIATDLAQRLGLDRP